MRGGSNGAIAVAVAVAIAMACGCGGTKRAPAPVIANAPTTPTMIDAGGGAGSEVAAGADDAVDAEPEAAAPVEACSDADTAPVRVGGHDATARLIACDTPPAVEYDDERASLALHHRRAELVVDPGGGGDPISTELAVWDDGGEEGSRWSLLGVLTAKHGDDAVLVQVDSYGPAQDLAGVSAVVQAWAVRGDALEKVGERSAAVAFVTIAKDRRSATIATCDQADGAPTGGGGCDGGGGAARYEGDGKTIEWRWDGKTIAERVKK